MVACSTERGSNNSRSDVQDAPYILVLGTIQDAGSPHIGCDKICCSDIPDKACRKVSSLAIVDPQSNHYWILDATPDFPAQNRMARNELSEGGLVPTGIFLTHAHIGHYTGLMYLGREAKGSQNVPVYAMPRMDSFLRSNGPWSQLVDLNNIELKRLKADSAVQLTPDIRVTPFLVPHRDEYSETVGFRIEGPNKSALFIPDINKWTSWERSINDEVHQVDLAFIDATFYSEGELPGRPMSEIPHPFVVETRQLFEHEPDSIKNRIQFIHLNHSNPLLYNDSVQNELKQAGYRMAKSGGRYPL